MHVRDHGSGERAVAVLTSLALFVLVLGSTGAFAVEPGGCGEPCAGCRGCDSGDCEGGENPLTSHHHCCPTCCLSHAPVLLSTSYSAPALIVLGATARNLPIAVTGSSPETPYRPPRV